ncbi:MAG: hypothetical protein J2O49_11780 [Sciscionella sp.]|nr:hypothetical protein [Sciscionella sp.]
MAKKRSTQFVSLLGALNRRYPELDDAEAAIVGKAIVVDGAVVVNPRSRVRQDAVIKVVEPKALRGARKLAAALDHFAVPVEGRVAVDLGAAAGGFTGVLIQRGASVVYAVDAGHGQLLGSLRQHPRVRNLERTNLAQLSTENVPDDVDIVTMDLSYLSIADAIGQLGELSFAENAELIALVKPMFELGLGELPTELTQCADAVALAADGVRRCQWEVLGSVRSPVTGSHGATEFLLHAKRKAGDG